jgi:hypothetical protein
MTAAAFKLTPELIAERDIHEACASALDRLLLPPAMWFCYPAGATQLSPQQMARYSKLGLKRGLPDLWFLYRGVRCIELKRLGGSMSRTTVGRTKSGAPRVWLGQEDVFPALVRSGGVLDIKIAHSVGEMLSVLERWQIPLRSHHR